MQKQKGWWAYSGFVLLLALFLLVRHAHDPLAVYDSDTQKIIHGIQAHTDPWIWWVHDWPLNNHFYRPISTALFQFDLDRHPQNAAGWLWTNSVLVAMSIGALGWFLRELTDSIALAAGAVFLFFLWNLDLGVVPAAWAPLIAGIVLILGLWRHGLQVRRWLPAVLVWLWVGSEFAGITTLYFRDEGWIPGRTATSMTVAALVSMAAFARICRCSPGINVEEPAPSPLDRPATRNTKAESAPRPAHWLWGVLSAVACAVALGCYEQAVMLPALLALTALAWRLRGRRVPWLWGVPFVAVLAGYLFLHLRYVPHTQSTYYKWQKRTWQTSLAMLQRYLFFPYQSLREVWLDLVGGWQLWLFSSPWLAVLTVAASLTALWEARRKWILFGFGWIGSTIAYLPMAFYKDFDHYHYWPMAIRSVAVCTLVWIATDLTISAVSPQSRQAPPRLHPAPGSLPHR